MEPGATVNCDVTVWRQVLALRADDAGGAAGDGERLGGAGHERPGRLVLRAATGTAPPRRRGSAGSASAAGCPARGRSRTAPRSSSPAATLVPVGDDGRPRSGRREAPSGSAEAWLLARVARGRRGRRRRRASAAAQAARITHKRGPLPLADVLSRHGSGDSTWGRHWGATGPSSASSGRAVMVERRPASVTLAPVGLADVEGVDHHFAQRGDPGRDHVEVRLEEGPGDPVQQPDLVGCRGPRARWRSRRPRCPR